MAYREYVQALEAEYLQPPPLAQVPASVPLDFTNLRTATGKQALVDLNTLWLETDSGKIPAQFSPALDFHPSMKAAGTLHFLAPAAAGPSLKARLHLRATDDPQSMKLPFPPRSYRKFKDGRAVPPPYFPRMQVAPQPGGRLDVEDNGKLVTSYHYRADEPRPYLFPLIGPAGRPLTRVGHPHDPGDTHLHHHSLWVGYRGVNGENFWEETKGGRLVHRSFPVQEDGAVFARFISEVDWIAPSGRKVLVEQREIGIYTGDGSRLLDFTLRFRPAEGEVKLDKTTFGFLAVRAAKSMTVFDGAGELRNSEGAVNEPAIFGKPARWCDFSGPITEREWNGIALMEHPGNPRHPTSWHVRHDGWMGAAFGNAGEFTIAAGQTLELRYRMYLHAGNAPEAKVEAVWHDYAYPPRVTLGTVRAA